MICQILCAITLSVTTPANELPKGLTFNQTESFSSQVQLHPVNVHMTTQQEYINKLYQAQMVLLNGKINRQFIATPARVNDKYMLGGKIFNDPHRQFTFHGDTYFMDRKDQ
ncbi:hypothetical protein [Shewanella sp. UCD-KL12]|uniref:hypothetical protein n=1 Tax=Shewanella sp. UCD-KL12 TaxID=1917163 RepID=UPI000970A7D2|nr:hypothetical protein [Shewanella sp. UCD-KL12]